MLKAMRLAGVVVSCSISMAAFAEKIEDTKINADLGNNEVLLNAIKKQMKGKEVEGEITPEKVKKIIDVARSQIRQYNKKSIAENKEYGGVIFEKDGVIQASETVSGKKCLSSCGVNLDGLYNNLLHQAKTEKIVIYSDWHTHSSAGDKFSKPDQDGMVSTMEVLHKMGHPYIGAFYGNPSGNYNLVTFNYELKGKRTAFDYHTIGSDYKAFDDKIIVSMAAVDNRNNEKDDGLSL